MKMNYTKKEIKECMEQIEKIGKCENEEDFSDLMRELRSSLILLLGEIDWVNYDIKKVYTQLKSKNQFEDFDRKMQLLIVIVATTFHYVREQSGIIDNSNESEK